MQPSQDPRLKVEQVGEVTVARFIQRHLMDEGVIRAVGEQLSGLVGEGCRRLLLDFGTVEYVASMMLAAVISLNKKLQTVNGRLAICRLNPAVRQAFVTLQLDKLLAIRATEQEALQVLQ